MWYVYLGLGGCKYALVSEIKSNITDGNITASSTYNNSICKYALVSGKIFNILDSDIIASRSTYYSKYGKFGPLRYYLNTKEYDNGEFFYRVYLAYSFADTYYIFI